jgi:hypothetical protein
VTVVRRKIERRVSARELERSLWPVGMEHRCVRHGPDCQGRVAGHHVIAKQALRRRGLHAFLWDRRNRMPLCEFHHQRHTLRYDPVPSSLLSAEAREFAAELGLEWLLEKSYP